MGVSSAKKGEFTQHINFNIITTFCEVPETGLTFVENSILKARNASLLANLPAIADDSGIEVDALSGRPGIYSARYAGEECDDEANNKLLLKELKGVPLEKRTARYRCSIVFLRKYDYPTPKIFDATWEGFIGTEGLIGTECLIGTEGLIGAA